MHKQEAPISLAELPRSQYIPVSLSHRLCKSSFAGELSHTIKIRSPHITQASNTVLFPQRSHPTTRMSIDNVVHASAVASYTEGILVPPTPALSHAYENSTQHGIPMIAVSPAQGKFLSLLTQMSGAKNVLELGTLGGYSSIWFAEALKANGGGKVTSIEIDPARREVSIENLKYAGVGVPEEVEVLLGAGLEVLPRLEQEIRDKRREKFDFVFIDADWNNQWAYFDWGVKLSKGKGSIVYVDNVVRQLLEIGAVGPAAKDDKVENLVESIGKDERVEAVVMQTVGAKDYDGFLVAVVK